MKASNLKVSRATRPTAAPTLAPTAADAPETTATYVLEARQGFDLEPFDGEEATLSVEWRVRLEGDGVYLALWSENDAAPDPSEKTVELGKLVGGFFSVTEFRRCVAALNALAATLPATAVPHAPGLMVTR